MLRIVVRVNQIVQDTRMVWLTSVHVFKQCGSVFLLLESFGALWHRAEDGESVEQLCLVIRILRTGGRHCVPVPLIARGLAANPAFVKERSHRREIELLPIRRLRRGETFLDQ